MGGSRYIESLSRLVMSRTFGLSSLSKVSCNEKVDVSRREQIILPTGTIGNSNVMTVGHTRSQD
jgi:hypothetical protein